MKKFYPFVLLALCSVSSVAWPYKQGTHKTIAEYAVRHSVLGQESSGVTASLGLGKHADDRAGLLPSTYSYALTLTPSRLIQRGVEEEDAGLRALRHFYDPQNDGRGLNYLFSWFMPSPRWSLEDVEDHPDQEFSYKDAKRLLHSGLIGATEEVRNRELGKAFEAIGHVIHHLQDMAQPQHVRNDVHCDEKLVQVFASSWVALPICQPLGAYRPSAYEDFTYRRGTDIPLPGYDPIRYGSFEVPSQLWSNDFAGIAEFTSRNFVSAGTNFYTRDGTTFEHPDYPSPIRSYTFLDRRNITDPDLLGPTGPNQPLSGEIWFIGSRVFDRHLGSEALNKRAASYSIFESDLRATGHESKYTLNRFNYASANDFLLPRAAAYSAGLINYFFRGRIEIGLPEEGVYGILDHATTYAAGQGFDKLKLKLRNASPDGVKPSGERVPQAMQGGTLVAVAKYTLNSCYQPDLTGDFAATIDTGEVIYPAGCSLDQYFAGEEQISQSAAIVAASLDTGSASEFTFDFSSQPIPVNARDLRIQVVYTGQLGAEADGIAFGGRDISEPTHLMVYNNSDYYAVDGKFYTPQQIRADATLSERVKGQDIDPKPLDTVVLAVVPGKPLTGAAGPVAVNGYVRVAVLADVDQPFSLGVLTRFEGAGYIDTRFDGIWANTTDLRAEQIYITPFGVYRGARGHLVDVVFRANSNTPLLDGELVTMSSRTVPDPGPTPIPLRF